MQTKETNNLVKGALLLTVAGIVSKMLSAAYRIPLQNLTGDVGFYIYQQVYPILGMTLILSLYGFPSALARIAVIVRRERATLSITHFILPLFFLLVIINGMIAFILHHNAYRLAQFIGDTQLAPAFEKVALVFLLIPFTALLRGVFQSRLHMQPIAFSQVGEQIVRVCIILGAAILYSSNKLTTIYQVGEWAAYAALLGGGIAIIILSIHLFRQKLFTFESFSIPWKKYIYAIVVLGVVASLNHMILLLIQLADTLTLIPALQSFGLTKDDAMVAKGIFDRGQPLIQLGTVIGSSFALTLIPEAAKNTHVSTRSMTDAMIFSFYLAIGATTGLLLIFPETNLLLYKDLNGTLSLQILSLAVLLSTMSVTAIAVLQGVGIVVRTALFILLAFIVKGLGNIFIVPYLGITGSALATVFSLLFLTILVFIELQKKFPLQLSVNQLQWKPLSKAVLSMFLYIIVVKYMTPTAFLQSRLFLLGYVLFVVISGSLIYLIVLVKNRAFTTDQVAALPLSRFFINL